MTIQTQGSPAGKADASRTRRIWRTPKLTRMTVDQTATSHATGPDTFGNTS